MQEIILRGAPFCMTGLTIEGSNILSIKIKNKITLNLNILLKLFT